LLHRPARHTICGIAVLVLLTGSASAQTPPGDVPWRSLGPRPATSDPFADGSRDYGPISGRVTALAVDPQDASGNTLYAGTAGGGVWKSTNAAHPDPEVVVWSPLTDAQATLVIGALVLKPGDSSVILAGTGEGRSFQPGSYGRGILRSTDGGATWSLIAAANGGARPFRGLGFSALAFSTDAPEVAVAAAAATLGGSVGATTPGATAAGLYVSSNAGATWQLATLRNGSTVVAPVSATAVVYHAGSGRFFAALRGYGFYSSTNGVDWERLAAQPGGATLDLSVCAPGVTAQCPMQMGALAVRPGGAELFAWYSNANQQGLRMFRSGDGGASWTELSQAGIESCGDPAGCGATGAASLYLAAVAAGGDTDLYAGAVNIFKCRLSSADPTCSSAGAWRNLTHALGCTPLGAPAKVHPDQQALAAADPSLLFFANAGGVYRTRNAAGLQSGSCSVPNPFENLNAGLGPLAQMRSLAQHPGNAGALLAGTRDNGYLALDTVDAGSDGLTWQAVGLAPGAAAAIDHAAPAVRFLSGEPVSIQRCELGTACRAGDFATILTGANLGGDATTRPVHFLPDSQVAGRLLVGTCRVWRGPSTGTGWTAANAISPNFETGTADPCLVTDSNQIRALAAGGPTAAAGSQVIYAGTAAGRVFVTTNAAGGTGTWSERTSGINPQGYAIGDIVLDPSDASGQTAYLALVGFGAGRVFRTTNAGAAWANITGDLPDSPVNALQVDPLESSILYAGTDAGVFLTMNGGANWVRYGPAAGAGALPNAAVTRLAALDAGPAQRLRAATWGRGAWEADLASALEPAFFLTLDAEELVSYPGFPQAFRGTLTAVHGYNALVAVSCESSGPALPATCSGESVTPSAGGAGFTVAAHDDAPADYSFNILAEGTDAGRLTRRQAVTLRVVDYALGAPSPSSVTLAKSATSAPVTFTVSAQGSFSAPVTLSCAGMPANAACTFQPSNVVTPAAGAPVNASLTVTTGAATPEGSFPVTLRAQASGAPSARERGFTLVVSEQVAQLDLAVGLSASASPAPLGHNLTYTAQVSNVSGVAATGVVLTLTETAALNVVAATPAQGACSLTPAVNCILGTLGAGASASVSLVVAPLAAGQAALGVSAGAAEADMNLANNQARLEVAVSDFALSISPVTLTVLRGRSTAATLTLRAEGGAYLEAAALACSGLPPLSVCRFSLEAVTPGVNQGSADVFISTAPAAWLPSLPEHRLQLFYGLALLPLAGIVLLSRRRRRRWLLLLPAALALLTPSCGGGPGPIPTPGSPGTPLGLHTITITATSGTVQKTGTITLTVN
jgi:uncharacterized repeat protein (TIGR01451 family)